MTTPTSGTLENPELPPRKGGTYTKGTPAATDDAVDVAYSDERLSRSPWPREVPPTGVLTGVLGEMSSYYGACWLHYRSTQHRGKTQ